MTADPARVWALAVLDAAGVDVGPADVGKAAEVVRLIVEDAELRARADAALEASRFAAYLPLDLGGQNPASVR